MEHQNQPLSNESKLPVGPFDKPETAPQIDKKRLYVDTRNQVLLHGANFEQAMQYAMANGADEETAKRLIATLHEELHGEKKREGRADLIWGAVALLGGIITTALSYSIASDTGGSYVVTYGIIAYGLFRMIRGLTKIA